MKHYRKLDSAEGPARKLKRFARWVNPKKAFKPTDWKAIWTGINRGSR